MKLVIGENEGKILSLLEQHEEGCRNALITDETGIPAGSVGTTLKRMLGKGWLETEVRQMEHPTPVADTYTLYSISDLGKSALQAWRVYFGEAPC